MREIPLTKGKVALVDDEDYERLASFKWSLMAKYAARYWKKGDQRFGKAKSCFMHHVVVPPPDGMFVDHINGDRLDNRKSNLRVCTNAENNQNRVKNISKAGFKGVYSAGKAGCKRLRAIIYANGRSIRLGWFDTEGEAALAYDRAAREHFGAFAAVNFPGPGERSAVTGEMVPLQRLTA